MIMKEILGKNNLNLVKDLRMRYVNVIIIVDAVYDKNKRHYFRTNLRVSLQAVRKIAPNTCKATYKVLCVKNVKQVFFLNIFINF